jgi:hypothetical protein
MRLVILNELTLLRLIGWAAMRADVLLVGVNPYLTQFEPLLDGFVRVLERRGLVSHITDRFPDLKPFRSLPNYSNLSDFYLRVATSVEKRFDFAKFDNSKDDYALPFKHATWSYIARRGTLALLIATLAERGMLAAERLYGFDDDLLNLAEAYAGASLAVSARTFPTVRRWLNGGVAALVGAIALFWILPRLRLKSQSPREYFIGATFATCMRTRYMLQDLASASDQVFVLLHGHRDDPTVEPYIEGFNRGILEDGRISLIRAWPELVSAWRDLIALYRSHSGLSVAHFIAIVRLSFVRLKYRVFLMRYRFRYFWGKDDYDTVHMIRTQELRRLGTISASISHGLPVTNLIEPVWRYLDFDYYFLFGASLYERYYRATWPRHMKVSIVGAYGMTREMLTRSIQPRPCDIAFFANPTLDDVRLKAAVRTIATAFPERTVYFKVKLGRWHDGYFRDFHAADNPPNLVFTSDDSYELMLKASYAVGTISTVVAEAIQYGLIALALDLQPDRFPYHYRDFPDLCVRTGEEIVARIQAYEAGTWRYPREHYRELIDLSGRVVYDVIRQKLGIPAKGSALEQAAE